MSIFCTKQKPIVPGHKRGSAAYMSHNLREIRAKRAYFLVNEHFCVDFLKKMSIFCTPSQTYILPLFPGFSAKKCEFTLFWALFRKKVEKNVNFLHKPFHSPAGHISRICASFWAKSAQNRRNSWFFRKKCKFFAIFCTKEKLIEISAGTSIYPMIWTKIAQNLGFSAIFRKKVQFFATFISGPYLP